MHILQVFIDKRELVAKHVLILVDDTIYFVQFPCRDFEPEDGLISKRPKHVVIYLTHYPINNHKICCVWLVYYLILILVIVNTTGVNHLKIMLEAYRYVSSERRFGRCSKEDFAVLSASLWCLPILLSIATGDSYPMEAYLFRLSTGVKNAWRFTHTSQYTIVGVCWRQGVQQLSTS